jgi:methylmalonyl-CoA/ethylmalonyl-CoA epimerase
MSLFGPIKQVAYVVPDIEVAIQNWHRQMGVGPFALVREAKPLEGSVYRGQVSHGVCINLAFAYLGDVQLHAFQL